MHVCVCGVLVCCVCVCCVKVLCVHVQVFSATGLDIISQTRVEHLPESEKSKHKTAK